MGFEKYVPRARTSRVAPPLLNVSKSHGYLNPAAAALLGPDVDAIELWFDRQAMRLALVPAEASAPGVLKVSSKANGTRGSSGRAFSMSGAIQVMGIPEPSQWTVKVSDTGGRQLLLCERIIQPVRLPIAN